MSTLYIHLPSKAAAEAVERWIDLPCPFAVTGNGDAITREGAEPLPRLAQLVAGAKRVVLLLAASDVSLLRVQVPPMSAARLRAALPNMVEDQLITDPAECVVLPGVQADGLRTVAVVQRAWLDVLARTLLGMGARQLVALPSQLCLPLHADAASAAAFEQGDGVDLAIRMSAQDGIGLPVVPENPRRMAAEVVETMAAVVPQSAIVLYVPQAQLNDYQAAADEMQGGPDAQGERRITVQADSWHHWIAGAAAASPDMMTGLGAASGPKTDWRRWRWPAVLAALLLLLNVIALNMDWLRMRREADTLRAGMEQTYRKTFPKDAVVIDPLAQMRQKIAAAKREGGQGAPDDFIVLAAAFGEAWGNAGRGIAALEYRDRSLYVRFKPDAQAQIDRVKPALAARDLSVAPAPAQGGAVVWQIRSGK